MQDLERDIVLLHQGEKGPRRRVDILNISAGSKELDLLLKGVEVLQARALFLEFAEHSYAALVPCIAARCFSILKPAVPKTLCVSCNHYYIKLRDHGL